MKSFIPSLAIFSTCFAAIAAKTPAEYFDNDVYATWLETNQGKYEETLFLNTTDDSTGIGLFWTIDRATEVINLAVVCPTGDGWCAFGIGEAGGMLGSDMVIYESQGNELYDAHVLDDANGGPIRDSCQNWKLINSVASGDDGTNGILLFEAQRALDTGDTFDRVLIDDREDIIPPTRVIGAWLDTPTVSFHGNNVVRSSVRFFATGEAADDEIAFRVAMADASEGTFELRANNYAVPEMETYYAHFCFTYADLIAQGLPNNTELHTIGIEPDVDDDAKEFVHHYVLSASLDPLQNYTSPIAEEVCDELPITETVYVWAPGEGPFAFPENIGSLLGNNGYKSFNLEIHYNNPSLKAGILDSSGVRMHWTTKKREFDMGVLQLGDPYVSLYDELVGPGLTHHTFDCPASCSEATLTEPVTVIREYLHMHKVGTSIYNEQIRDGEVIHRAAVDFWDFNQQGNAPVQQGSFQILPGDAFRTRCYHTSTNQVWGLGSQEEMCMSFLFYYPRQVVDDGSGNPFPYTCGRGLDFFAECNADYANATVRNTEELVRSFGNSDGGTCNKPNDTDTNTTDNEEDENDTSAASVTTAILASQYSIIYAGLLIISTIII